MHRFGGVRLQPPITRQFDARQVRFVASGAAQLLEMAWIVAPQRNAALAFVQQLRQRRSPGARAKHRDFHGVDCFLFWFFFGDPTRFSVPFSKR